MSELKATYTTKDWKQTLVCESEEDVKLVPNPKYPIIHHPHIYQYDDNVFVWFDEAGLVGGACETLELAERALASYGQSLMDELCFNEYVATF